MEQESLRFAFFVAFEFWRRNLQNHETPVPEKSWRASVRGKIISVNSCLPCMMDFLFLPEINSPRRLAGVGRISTPYLVSLPVEGGNQNQAAGEMDLPAGRRLFCGESVEQGFGSRGVSVGNGDDANAGGVGVKA